MIRTDRFKDGKQHIVTMSYDDGPDTDLKLIEIFNKYGIKRHLQPYFGLA